MVLDRSTRWLVVLGALLVLALPTAAAQAKPMAHAAGGGAVPIDPPIVAVPMQRTDRALNNAADAINAGKGADAVGPITAARRYLIRSYTGAKWLIVNAPPAPAAADFRITASTYVKQAKQVVRDSRRPSKRKSSWIKARKSGTVVTGPTFADTPTAVFDVFTNQFNAANAAVGMVPDTTGKLATRVTTAYNTAIILRNRLVKYIYTVAPPAPAAAAEARVHAKASGTPAPAPGAPGTAPAAGSFDAVMPGVAVLIDAELQQLQATAADASVPAASQDGLKKAIDSDNKIKALVNQYWPPAPAAG
jgi:hypothetical protein